MFYTIKVCMIVMTVITVICSVLLTAGALCFIRYKSKLIKNEKENGSKHRRQNDEDNSLSAISSGISSINDCNAKHLAPLSFFSAVNNGSEYGVSRVNYSLNNRSFMKNDNAIISHYLEPGTGIENRHYNAKDNVEHFCCSDIADDDEDEREIMPPRRNLPTQKKSLTQKH